MKLNIRIQAFLNRTRQRVRKLPVDFFFWLRCVAAFFGLRNWRAQERPISWAIRTSHALNLAKVCRRSCGRVARTDLWVAHAA